MDIGVSFQPLGHRFVMCVVCQKWGHSKEIAIVSNQWDPFSGVDNDNANKAKEDKEKRMPLDESEVHRSKVGVTVAIRRQARNSDSSSESRRERKRRKRERNTGQGETAEKTQSIANAPNPKIPKTKNLEGKVVS
jgi:hypothetical protein